MNGIAERAVARCKYFQCGTNQATRASRAAYSVHDGMAANKLLHLLSTYSDAKMKYTQTNPPHPRPITNLTAANICQDTEKYATKLLKPRIAMEAK